MFSRPFSDSPAVRAIMSAVALSCLLPCLGARPTVGAVPVTRDTKAVAVIAVSPQASEGEKFAAQELQTFVEAISGAKLQIQDAPPDADVPALLIGRAAGLDAEAARLKQDGFILRTDGNRLRIAGHNDRGTIYAVYALLESLGCRWFAAGELGQALPNRPTIEIPPLDLSESPDFDVRAFFVATNAESALWALRNRMNGFFAADFARGHGNLLHFQPPLGHIHSFYQLMPVEKYFADHPEYYPLIAGKRTKISHLRGQLCTTNPNVIRIVAEQAREYFEKNPDARIFTIGPNDGMGWCECEPCKALDAKLCDSKTWAFRDGRDPVTSDRLAEYSNAVAEQALRGLPGRELYTFAYLNYVEPPVSVKPVKGVTHWLCHYAPACYNHEIADPDCPVNAGFNKDLRAWAALEPWMGVYAYTDKSMWVGLPRPALPQMAADLKYLYSLGVRKYVAQSNARNWPQMGALYYATAKLLWKADRPLSEILDDYYDHFFGPAGPAMRRFDVAVWKTARASGAHYSDNPLTQALPLFDPDKLAPAAAHLDAALAANPDDAQKQRVEKIKAAFEFGIEFLRMLRDIEEYEKTGDPDRLKAAAPLAEKHVKRCAGHPGVQRILEGVITEGKGAMSVSWEGFAKPETKGGRECRNSDETGPGDGAAGWATFRVLIRNPAKTYLVTMVVWGESSPFSLVICSKGRGKGASDGGVWRPLKPEGAVSGRPEWCTLKFRVTPDLFDPETKRQILGFGGGDSQVWVADFQIAPLD